MLIKLLWMFIKLQTVSRSTAPRYAMTTHFSFRGKLSCSPWSHQWSLIVRVSSIQLKRPLLLHPSRLKRRYHSQLSSVQGRHSPCRPSCPRYDRVFEGHPLYGIYAWWAKIHRLMRTSPLPPNRPPTSAHPQAQCHPSLIVWCRLARVHVLQVWSTFHHVSPLLWSLAWLWGQQLRFLPDVLPKIQPKSLLEEERK